MEQISLFGESEEKIVNVAAVPMRSPFRYAGGKTWLVPRIRSWLSERGGLEKTLIEPFAGGGIVSLGRHVCSTGRPEGMFAATNMPPLRGFTGLP
ncbi:MAG TPA: hypothetical protein ENL10_04935 [Candidatus Cloacimonetes bacterium]|nr:hypothetical protein [Candidatus Cloacimonadota bacterium]